jgi:hypothetical protein
MFLSLDRPLEKLTGPNRGIVHMRLDNQNCMTPIKDQLRSARPRHMRDTPVALRRGWVLCVLQRIADNRSEYLGVANANLDYSAPLTRK